jgi:Ca-activated chloride channel family protein
MKRGKITAKTLGLIAAVISLLNLAPLYGAGLLIADGGLGGQLEIVSQDVEVIVNNGIAVTTVTQEFRNLENRQVEALYTFPVPEEASVSNFSMWIKGKEMTGEVVEKERARKIYNSYKRRKRDPGLLEQNDYKSFEMRIFPIEANAIQKVQITYYQELKSNRNWCTYVYPLKTTTRKFQADSASTRKRFSFNFQVKSEIPITELESPSHGKEFVTASYSPNYAQASLEKKKGNLNKDIVISYKLERAKTGIDFIFSKEKNRDGYFLMTITAGEELKELNQGMDFVFVLDISGSMANDGKMKISRNSINEFIKALSKDDRFEMVTFNINTHTLFNKLESVNSDTMGKGIKFLENQTARGGTDLRPAINRAYEYSTPDRQLNVIVLSDGMTEQGTVSSLINIIKNRPANTKVFCIGVGNEVNKPLLKEISEESGGLASFISRGDNFKRRAEGFRRTLMHPAVSNITIDFGNGAYDIEPENIPNLYYGIPVRIYGRYKTPGKCDIKIEGEIMGRVFRTGKTIKYPAEDGSNPEIERMWAREKMQNLINKGKRENNIDKYRGEIVRLGEGYSIVSEYTSFLVLENDAEYRRWKIERLNALRTSRDRAAQERLKKELEKLKNASAETLVKAENIPESGKAKELSSTNTPAPALPSPAPAAPAKNRRNNSIDFSLPNMGHGGGAVDGFTLLLTGIIALLAMAAFIPHKVKKK